MDTNKSPIAIACEIVGSQAEMARKLGIPPAMVNQWIKGRRPIPAEYCKAIELFTEGEVTVMSLLPKRWQKIWPELPEHTKAVA